MMSIETVKRMVSDTIFCAAFRTIDPDRSETFQKNIAELEAEISDPQFVASLDKNTNELIAQLILVARMDEFFMHALTKITTRIGANEKC